ncbi:MAG: hypothetical protein ABEK04_00675 [Candidatus Nanohalobium sp.]
MAWYALEDLDEAMEKTKEILLPFDLMTWTKIGIIALFVGGGMNIPSAPTGPQSGGQDVYTPDGGDSAADNFSTGAMNNITGMATGGVTNGLAVAIVLVVLAVVGFFTYISSVFEFIYYQTILDEEPTIIKDFSKHSGKGLRYFGFKIGFFLLILLSIVLLGGAFTVNMALGAIALILWIPFAIAAVIFAGLVHDFALLKMIETDQGLIEAWRNVWPDIKREWRQVAVYMVVKFFIGVGIALASLFIMLAVIFVLLIPFGILGLIGALIHPALVIPVVILGALVFGLVMFFVKVPFSTYLYTYITLVYHDITS